MYFRYATIHSVLSRHCDVMVTHWTDWAVLLHWSFIFFPSSPEVMPYGGCTSLLSLFILLNFSPLCLLSAERSCLSPFSFCNHSVSIPLTQLHSCLSLICLNTQEYTHKLPCLPSCQQSATDLPSSWWTRTLPVETTFFLLFFLPHL